MESHIIDIYFRSGAVIDLSPRAFISVQKPPHGSALRLALIEWELYNQWMSKTYTTASCLYSIHLVFNSIFHHHPPSLLSSSITLQPASKRLVQLQAMTSIKTAASLLALAGLYTAEHASAIPCAAFDGSGSVAYVFGAPYGDYSLGSDLTAPSFQSLTNKTGRPDFTGSNTQCFVVGLGTSCSA